MSIVQDVTGKKNVKIFVLVSLRYVVNIFLECIVVLYGMGKLHSDEFI